MQMSALVVGSDYAVKTSKFTSRRGRVTDLRVQRYSKSTYVYRNDGVAIMLVDRQTGDPELSSDGTPYTMVTTARNVLKDWDVQAAEDNAKESAAMQRQAVRQAKARALQGAVDRLNALGVPVEKSSYGDNIVIAVADASKLADRLQREATMNAVGAPGVSADRSQALRARRGRQAS